MCFTLYLSGFSTGITEEPLPSEYMTVIMCTASFVVSDSEVAALSTL